MTRSSKKKFFIAASLIKKFKNKRFKKNGEKALIKTWSRSSTIIPDFVNFVFLVHNGKKFERVKILQEMVGNKLGSYSLTKKTCNHKGIKKKEKLQKK